MSNLAKPLSIAALVLSIITAIVFGLIYISPNLDSVTSILAAITLLCAIIALVAAFAGDNKDLIWMPLVALLIGGLAWSFAPAFHQRIVLNEMEEEVRSRPPIAEQLKNVRSPVAPPKSQESPPEQTN
ncbi:MAG TPA: hypothetical protein PK975_12075 [Candidatus Hydrogenedentes bacterium]|nr:hypothetical protein [Candidatus Hydrogenedentota bacterium]